MFLHTALALFADGDGDGGGQQQNQSPGGGFLGMLPFLLAMGFLFYFLMIRPMRKQEAQRKALASNIKKNDKVLTQSGIIGWVQNFSDTDDEVVIRIEDNVKVRMLKSAIVQNLTQQEELAKQQKEKEAAKK
jgi:preprotein translocase subunit YajC